MSSVFKKSTACFIAIVMLLSSGLGVMAFAAANCNGDCDNCPTIVIPGIFQSEVHLYDDNGNIKLNTDGDEYKGPFYMKTTDEIVKLALSEALLPISKLLITQRDKDSRAASAIAQVLGKAMLTNIASDSNGKLINNVKATQYHTSAANLSAYDREYILRQIPLNDYVSIAGADHLYFLSYVSFGNIMDIASQLYDLIQIAKEETGHDKVNLVPISQGGSIFNALIQMYAENDAINFEDDINRVCFIVPAADGTSLLGCIYRDGLLDDNAALYGTMFPSLMDEDQQWLAYLINIVLRIMPNADLNNILDMAVDELIGGYLKNSTAIWGLIASEYYTECANKYLSGEENAVIRTQTDWYYNAQCNSRSNILAAKEAGVEFFDVVDYNYSMYQICDTWDKCNADGIIQTDSTSFGATSVAVDTPLADDYIQADTYCTCKGEHNHMDERRLVDASTGILCESTFYFYGQDHEKTSRNDVIIRLATRILTDNTFTDVYSDPAYPQFNTARISKNLISDINNWKNYNTASLSAEDAAELAAAIEEAEAVIANTVVDTEAFNNASNRFYAITAKISNGGVAPEEKTESKWSFTNIITVILKWYSELLLKLFGGKGWSDILLFR